MRLGKDLIDKPIYTLDEGKLLGKIQDLYLDNNLETVIGIFLGAQGLVRRRAQLIRSGDVTLFGIDTVLVRNAEVVTDDGELVAAKDWLRRDKLAGRDVDTPGGTPRRPGRCSRRCRRAHHRLCPQPGLCRRASGGEARRRSQRRAGHGQR